MTNSHAAPQWGTWQVPQCPFVIEYDVETLKRIAGETAEGYRALPHGGLEVGGLLLGTFTGDRMRIRGFQPIACDHAAGPTFTLSATDKTALEDQLTHLNHRADVDGRRVLGWYHSHTRSGLALSPEDLSVHYKFFPEPWHVALVLRPQTNGGARAGFFVREPGGAAMRTSASYLEFAIESDDNAAHTGAVRLSAPPPRHSRPAQPPGPPLQRMNEAPPPALREPAAPPVREPAPAPRILTVPHTPAAHSRWGVWAALAAMFIGSLGAVLYLRHYSSQTAKAPPAGFVRVEAVNKGMNLEISWDTKALGKATQGRLDIQDGGLRAQLLLDDRTLAAGSVSYAYKSDVTGFHLRVERADGSALEGSTTYVAPNAPAEMVAAVKDRMEKDRQAQAAPDENADKNLKPVPSLAQVPPRTAASEPPKAAPPQTQAETPKAPPVTPPQSTATNAVDRAKPVETAQQRPAPAPVQTAQVEAPKVAPPTPQDPVPQNAGPQNAVPQNAGAQNPPARQNVPPQTATQQAAAPRTVVNTTPPASPAPPKPQIQLTGRWMLQPGAVSRSPGVPESVVIDVLENERGYQGTLDARYRGANSKQERQNLAFTGKVVNGIARFPWTSRDGKQRGEIEFIRVSPDTVEVVWYGADTKQVYDHIVRKAK